MIAESQSATSVMPKGAAQPPACSAKGPPSAHLHGDAHRDREERDGAGEREALLHAGLVAGEDAEHRRRERDDQRPEQQHSVAASGAGSETRISSISVVPST